MKLFVEPNMMRAPEKEQFELDAWIDSSPFEALLGLHIEQAADGRALLTLPFRVKLANGGGVMHGGALTSLADTAVAMAIKSVLPPDTSFATTELSMEFFTPVVSGQVTARAEVLGPEGRIFHGECDLLGDDGQLYARLKSVFKVARNRKGPMV